MTRLEDRHMDNKTRPDRRQSARCAMNADFFILFRPSLDRIGRLKDVSSGGVAVEYPVFDKREKAINVEVDIFASRPSYFMMRRVPCKVVYDIKIELPTLLGIETRLCGLRFEQLSQQHCELLKVLFMPNHK
jgi:hypothetical protein